MKENVSVYLRNPCSLNRERDAMSAAKAPKQDNLWCKMAQARVYVNHVALYGLQTFITPGGVPITSAMQHLVPYSDNRAYFFFPNHQDFIFT